MITTDRTKITLPLRNKRPCELSALEVNHCLVVVEGCVFDDVFSAVLEDMLLGLVYLHLDSSKHDQFLWQNQLTDQSGLAMEVKPDNLILKIYLTQESGASDKKLEGFPILECQYVNSKCKLSVTLTTILFRNN